MIPDALAHMQTESGLAAQKQRDIVIIIIMQR
jgi:hypothetical protein